VPLVWTLVPFSPRHSHFFPGWGGTENPKNTYNFASYDTLYNSTSKYNITNYWILDYNNQFYDGGLSPGTEAARQGMAQWAKAAVLHFQGKKILWEMYNEPNIAFWTPAPNVTAYALLSNAVGTAIRAAAPNEIYFGAGAAGIVLDFLENCFQMGTLEYWDAVSVHPYRQRDPETVQSEYFNLRRFVFV
jgi:hypothetical protein